MNVGIIGSGRIAKEVAKIICKKGFNITLIYSRNKKTGENLAKRFKSKFVNNFDEFINNKELIDFVYIATPHSSHFEYASKCILNKIPTLVEKPIAVNAKEVEELIKIQKENDTYLVEAMRTWFGSPLITLEKAIKEHRFGEIKNAKFDFEIYKPHFHKYDRLFDPSRAGGALLDLGIYLVTSAYKLFGEPIKIDVKTKIIKGVDILDKISFHYEKFDVLLVTGFSRFKDRLYIEFEDGYIKLPHGHKPNKIIVHKKDKNFRFKGETSYLNEFIKVSEEIKEGKKTSSFISLEDNLKIMTLMDQIREDMNLKFSFER